MQFHVIAPDAVVPGVWGNTTDIPDGNGGSWVEIIKAESHWWQVKYASGDTTFVGRASFTQFAIRRRK